MTSGNARGWPGSRRAFYELVVALTAALSIVGQAGCSSSDKSLIEGSLPPGNLGHLVNTSNDEFAPLLLPDSTHLLFTSNRGGGSREFISEQNRYGEDLFLSESMSGIWSAPLILPAPATSNLNEGTPTLAADGRTAIIARSHEPNGVGGSDLYEAAFDGASFSSLRNLGPTVNSSYWDAQPAVSPDGNLLIFASDRPGGIGGTDIYVSTHQANGGWSAPRNLGAPVNSKGNEYSPCFAADGSTLFFASEGRPDGLGKLDLYVATCDAGKPCTEPCHLPYPINSKWNDAFPFATGTLTRLFFASDREGGCGRYDLYASSLPPAKIILAGTIRDTSGTPLESPSEVIVTYKRNDIVAAKLETAPSASYYETPLEPGNTYTLRVVARGFYPSLLIEVKAAPKPIDQRIVQDVALVPLPRTLVRKGSVVFDLRSYEIPFFVTGYYRLNVPENLLELRELLKSRLKKAEYIERPGPEYDRFALAVKQIFDDSLLTVMCDTVLPMFRRHADPAERLRIEVVGYADPRPISGRYLESGVMFAAVSIRRNDPMTNDVLSTLRAYYTMLYLDRILSASADYTAIKDAGRITYAIRGEGIDVSSGRVFEARRRVRIIVTRE